MIATALAWHALPFGRAADSTLQMSDAVPGDHALVRATLSGDDGAFAEIMRRHKGRVFGTCSRFARDSHQLDDLCQEVFLRAWRRLRTFRGDAPFEHWLARLTVTACYDFLRRERRHRGHVELDDSPLEFRDTSVDAAIAASRARDLLDWAMRRLSAEEKLVLTLLELEERTVRDIAALTGWSESNVKVRAFRARARLREIIERSNEH
ncbi:MAG: sigma-70 family RNA polymerase sigma factor [Chthoniobacteraceae bacterium]